MRAVMLTVGMVLLLALGASAANAQLSKSLARNEADITAIGFSQHKPWAQEWKVGACRRVSERRIDCDARVTGDRLIGCSSGVPVTCNYVFHVCRFTVAVHEAGWERIGRVRSVRCRVRPHSG